ncbi:hypothetical protein TBS_31460 [Thermobispora bispora]|uniref:Uncharacterized protein n=1 Tax=Thermobispora bispora (strain ATCC 19993 / DSM 43833 / CBS 139.67 / JCM 10125 / KCTC 9307 / NBRC 14880 / R51) TaxID=469371 RepID=D6Y858_THEBD|nr:hypothetical protein [Thermobispora bispora]MBO2473923.1 hypothetical protein [Actinomycetales bacterium]MDI9580952.1 hypothetical protein [Thermobispora sp.]ADG89794.1 hypothetical protein Tbis_3099 [Thermobispora bispora DSM 43833]MBX6169017.1 hypothetical protein [Thermobispora bispora]QSI49379.1 hypothetical protein CYL17_17220 [Thermobispora bispora]
MDAYLSGLTAFLITLALAVALVLLYRSMSRKITRIQRSQEQDGAEGAPRKDGEEGAKNRSRDAGR